MKKLDTLPWNCDPKLGQFLSRKGVEELLQAQHTLLSKEMADKVKELKEMWIEHGKLVAREDVKKMVEGMRDGYNCYECGSEGYDQAIKDILAKLNKNPE